MINGKSLLVTGGTGSFGKAFIKEFFQAIIRKNYYIL